MASTSSPDGQLIPLLHEPLARAVKRASARVDLCSPFVGTQAAFWLATEAQLGRADWTLLTVLDPVAAAYGSLSVRGLRRLIAAGVDVRHAAGLHAKVFIVDSEGWVGSANLTTSGLGDGLRPNLELSVALTAAQVIDASARLETWRLRAKAVTQAMLDECEARASIVPVRTSPPPGGGRASSRASKANRILEDAKTARVWVKAVYQDAALADVGWGRRSFVTSSKRGRPSFARGDLLLIYAKYAGICNAVLEVTGDAYIDPRQQMDAGISRDHVARWPWISAVVPRLQVPTSHGVSLAELGLTGRSLQGGHCRMPSGGLEVAVRRLTS